MNDQLRDDSIPTLTGASLAAGVQAAASWIERSADALNALNVFPVPDGDTGTNMALTLSSAAQHVLTLAAADRGSPGLGEVAQAMARGALMGARGNSGVILAQILRGVARIFQEHDEADPHILAAALRAGADSAYAAVASPVEGTILTVARAAAGGAEEAARAHEDIAGTLRGAHLAAAGAVAQTPQLLPILREAGVVDAGGQGYCAVIEALLRSVRGEPLDRPAPAVGVHADLRALHDENDRYGYCTEVLFQGQGIDVTLVRGRLAEIGTSVLVVGDEGLLKVHVHTERPGAVLDLATEHGAIVHVKVENMQLQREEFGARAPAPAPEPPRVQEGTCVVAVAAGAGFQEILRSLGALVVEGAESMNPSVTQLISAIVSSPREQVIILPNNPNVRMAAEAARDAENERRVTVVPTRSIPEGIAAALALNPEADLAVNVPALTAAAERCHTIQMARAARDTSFGGLQVRTGDAIALFADRVVAAGPAFPDVTSASLALLPDHPYEIATVYVGARGSRDTAETIGAIVRERIGVETEIADGGQPQYDYILSVE